jgi:cysteine desulfurase/selenocysteine lyase
MARVAAARGIPLAIDGAQSLAQFPIDIAATGAAFFTASGHKFLMGPKRTGLLYVRRDWIARLRPTVVGAYSDESWSMPERRLALRAAAQRFEYGTQNDALVYGLEAAADLVETVGLDRIWAHNRALAERCREGLVAIAGVEIAGPHEAAARSAILSFRLRGRSAQEVAGELGRRRQRVRVVSEAGLDAIRVSFHVCNDGSHVSRLIEDVARLTGGTPRP